MMKTTTQSILLATLMATAGFATAQTVTNPTPAQGAPTVQRPADSGAMPATRAEVKGQVDTRSGAKVAAPAQGGSTTSGAAAPAGSGGMSANTRADVKAQVNNSSKAGASAQGDSTVSGSSQATSSSTSAERKAARAERKAARKAQREATANAGGKGVDSGPASPAKTAPQ
jgi:poly-gamma-glutamate capsule biosynthesis protein CapA/YwtB (metallophosphatase superfamily)